MKPAPFAFVRPSSLTEALEALSANQHAKVLAGGQSLLPLLSMRLAAPEMLVDINALAELAYVRSDADGVRVGALARHAEVQADADARRVQPLLAQALELVAHPTIRNRGTTVGSIVHADASAEMPAVLSLLGGSVTVASTGGTREIAAADLFAGPMESTLRPGELATEAFFPALRPGEGVACEEISRRHGDYALCGVAAVVTLNEPGEPGGAGAVRTVRCGYLSVCEVPTVVDASECFATGAMDTGALDAGALDAAGALALESLQPDDDIHASAAYRAQLVRVLTARVIRRAYDDAVRRRTEEAR